MILLNQSHAGKQRRRLVSEDSVPRIAVTAGAAAAATGTFLAYEMAKHDRYNKQQDTDIIVEGLFGDDSGEMMYADD